MYATLTPLALPFPFVNVRMQTKNLPNTHCIVCFRPRLLVSMWNACASPEDVGCSVRVPLAITHSSPGGGGGQGGGLVGDPPLKMHPCRPPHPLRLMRFVRFAITNVAINFTQPVGVIAGNELRATLPPHFTVGLCPGDVECAPTVTFASALGTSTAYTASWQGNVVSIRCGAGRAGRRAPKGATCAHRGPRGGGGAGRSFRIPSLPCLFGTVENLVWRGGGEGCIRRGIGHLGLTHTETQRGRLQTACGQRCVDSENSQTTPATTSTTPNTPIIGRR